MKISAKELGLKLNLEYALAAALLKLATATGQAREVEKVNLNAGGRGKPTAMFEVSDTITFDLTKPFSSEVSSGTEST